MSFQLTGSGLETQTQAEIVDELSAKLRATFGNNLNTSTSSIMGQLVNIVSEFRALDQQVALAIYRCFDPNGSVGVGLDRLAALTGSIRKGATVSVVEVVFDFNAPGVVANGDIFNNDDTSTLWQATGGPYAGGPGAVAGVLSAIDTGPLIANSNTNWSLVTANPDLNGVTNPIDDADIGRDQESDPDFRVRRSVELFAGNVGGLAAITAVVSKVNGVTSVRTYHNPNGPGVDADGIPFKAFNVVVETNPTPPGIALRQSIADAIFSATGAGGEAYGTDFPETVTDSEGIVQNVAFDLIDEVDVFINVDIDTAGTEQVVSTNMADVVAAQVLATANANFNGIGKNQLTYEYVAIVSGLQASGEITGAVSVAVTLSRIAQIGPFFDPLESGIRERPEFDSGRIVVTVTP